MHTAMMRVFYVRSGACYTPRVSSCTQTIGGGPRLLDWSSWHAPRPRWELRDITRNVVSACELDAERRRSTIRAGLPWYARLLLTRSLERYSALPGTPNLKRFRSGDRMYFLGCMSPCRQDVVSDS